jgi:hypothetical protein
MMDRLKLRELEQAAELQAVGLVARAILNWTTQYSQRIRQARFRARRALGRSFFLFFLLCFCIAPLPT